jgi:hypothetical protein
MRKRVIHIRQFLFLAVLFLPVAALSQQPFVTDDTDTVPKGNLEIELMNEFDRLHTFAWPETYQNNASVELTYGVTKNIEVGVAATFLSVYARQAPRAIGGIGDTSIAVKYNFRHDKEHSYLPAMAMSIFVQLPTGNYMRGLGSGVTNIGVNYMAQKAISRKSTVRVNGGFLFAGNTIVGQLGILSVRGHIFTGGASYVRTITRKLQLGAEFYGAVTSQFQLSAGQQQVRFGGNYGVSKRNTIDFALVAGRYSASPKFGFVIGLTHTFQKPKD